MYMLSYIGVCVCVCLLMHIGVCVCVNWRLCQCIHVCRGCRYWWPCLFGGGGGDELCKRGGRDYLGMWFVGKKWGGGWVS